MLKDKLRQTGIRYIPIDKLGRDLDIWSEFVVFWELLKLFRAEHPDVIHLNSSKIGGLGALAGRLAGVPNIIFTAHGWAFNEERGFGQKLAIKFLVWLTITLSHHTIAVSDKILEQAPALLIPRKKLFVIRNGIGSPGALPCEEARHSLSSKTKIELSDKFLVGTVAELHRNKGLGYAIEAMATVKKTLPKLRYLVLGEGDDRKRLQKIISRYRLRKTAALVGFVDDAPQYLSAFDIFILPSVTEAFGLSILEAGNAGLPVVATSVGGVPEIVEDLKTGILVRPRQPKELAAAIKFIMENPAKAAEFGRNLKEKVSREFTLERMVRETVALYQ